MTTNRREFLEHMGATAMLGALPLSALSPVMRALPELTPPAQGETWDFSWTAKLKGKKHLGLFDCAEVDSGYGVWRAAMWEGQHNQALGSKPAECGTVLVLRHAALVLGFNQAFWDKNGIGAQDKVMHPITQQGTDRNPALLSSTRNEVPAMFDAFSLPAFQSRGGVVLACNVALMFFSQGLAQKLNITPEEARRQAVAAMLPGVTLMPSGVFACVKAQEEGCHYVRAS